MMYLTDPSRQEEAIKLATSIDPSLEGINIQVNYSIYLCSLV